MRFKKFSEKKEMSKFSIDFTLDNAESERYKFLNDIFGDKAVFIDCEISSKRLFYSQLDIEEIVKIIENYRNKKSNDKFIITDFTNHKMSFIGVNDKTKNFLSHIFD